MRDSSKPFYVRKDVFLNCVHDTYENDSDDYLLTLANALMIVLKSRKTGEVDYNKYVGFVKI